MSLARRCDIHGIETLAGEHVRGIGIHAGYIEGLRTNVACRSGWIGNGDNLHAVRQLPISIEVVLRDPAGADQSNSHHGQLRSFGGWQTRFYSEVKLALTT